MATVIHQAAIRTVTASVLRASRDIPSREGAIRKTIPAVIRTACWSLAIFSTIVALLGGFLGLVPLLALGPALGGEGADLAVCTEHGARTQPRERADFGVRIDHRQLTVGADDVGVLAHLEAGEGQVLRQASGLDRDRGQIFSKAAHLPEIYSVEWARPAA